MEKVRYRSLWLSDIHLGHKDCKAEYLLDFLNHVETENLYLVGDIIDMWAMSKRLNWPNAHNQLLRRLLTMRASGTRVVYLPGNHDAPIQKYDGLSFADIEISRELLHETATGKKLLMLHGDRFDDEVCFGALHAWMGDKGYDLLLFVNRWYNKLRARMGFRYWSLAGHIKGKITGANKAMQRFKDACTRYAAEQGADGVICGHIHHPEICQANGVTYCNDGDWIENCSALTEDEHGNLNIVFWSEVKKPEHLYSLADIRQLADKKAA